MYSMMKTQLKTEKLEGEPVVQRVTPFGVYFNRCRENLSIKPNPRNHVGKRAFVVGVLRKINHAP